MEIVEGTRIGKYEVRGLLGAGGMGEVYRAFDTELKRHVALKFIPADIASDPRRMRRFEQEALAASALNHPSIVTVYDIGQTEGGRRFFVTELVEGTTLREFAQGRRLKLGDVLDIAAQVASALVESHGAGVVHRDIKPDNIMVRRDGYVKVLDFGLAKVTGRPSAVDTQADTQALVMTDAGAVMGTVSYMSPEQASGQEVDARTDIWSLGVVLYELLTGRLPFKGKSASHTIVSILDDEPAPLTAYLPDAPESLQEVVSDALAKDRDARFQTAKQLLAKLQRLKRRLDAGGSLDTTVSPEAASASGSEASGRATALMTPGAGATLSGAGRTTARSGDIFRTPTSPEEAHLTAPPPRRRRLIPIAALASVAVLALAAYAVYYFAWRGRAGGSQPFAPLGSMKLTRVPASGATVWAAISPDGKYAARVVFDAGVHSLRLRQLSTMGERDLVPPDPGINFAGAPVFSHDGAYVYYVAGKKGQAFRELFRVSLLGGQPQKLVYDVDSGVTLSPDGKRLAFRRHLPQTREDTLVVANEDGGGEQTFASYQLPQRIDAPAWSPDGQRIAYYVNGTDAEGYYVNLDAVAVGDRKVETVSAARWRSIGSLAWLSDATGLVLTARDRASLPNTPLQLWYVPYPGGEAQKITNDLNNYVGLSATADTRTLLVKQGRDVANIWLAPGGDSDAARQLTSSGLNGVGTISWLPDGRVVYDSDASGNTDIWVMNPDGTAARQLTFDPNVDTVPAVTPDGRYVFFRSNRGVGWSVWRMSPDGSNAREVVKNIDNNQTMGLQFSPDSRWLYYISRDEKGQPAVWRVAVEGGQPEKIIGDRVGFVRLSPDGKTIFSTHMESVPDATAKIYFFNAEGGAPVREMDAPPDMLDARDWSPDSQGIDYVVARDGAANLWRLPLAPGARPRQLTEWKSDLIYRFSWSPGGKHLAAARGTAMTDLVLIQNFR